MTNVLASETQTTIKLNSNYSPTQVSISRSLQYSYVSAKCLAVYPTSGTDTFTKIRAYISRADRTNISDTYILTEGNDYTFVRLHEGYLNLQYVYLNFTGNSTSEAWAEVVYDPK